MPGIAGAVALTGLLTGCAGGTIGLPDEAVTAAAEESAADRDADRDTTGSPVEDGPEEPAGEPEASDLVERSIDALNGASSMRIAMDLTTPGAGHGQVDVHLDDEANCTGTFTSSEQGTADVIRRGDDTWTRFDRSGWQYLAAGTGTPLDAETIDLLLGYYLYMPADAQESGMPATCDFGPLLGLMEGLSESPMRLGGTTTHDGVPARTVELLEEDGTVLVAAGPEPYLLHVETADGEMTFSDFGIPVDAVPPPDDLVLDLTDLSSGQIPA
ncbi:hypothetical protein [Streptomyces avicenniae]|uniref:hypothetical protein n=1 Tax=Streptomyces avicenniae TaxID=500153 RepID=UPI00069BB605|nr:hypothetical protein [Streptomyces avicenniae]